MSEYIKMQMFDLAIKLRNKEWIGSITATGKKYRWNFEQKLLEEESYHVYASGFYYFWRSVQFIWQEVTVKEYK